MAKQIHWYPGHMKRAQIEIEEKLKIVDCLIELLDARIPVSSRNKPMYEITKSKPRLVVFTKNDLADPKETKKWIEKIEWSGLLADNLYNIQFYNSRKHLLGNSTERKIYIFLGAWNHPLILGWLGLRNPAFWF